MFVNCSWVYTRWQQYSTHLHKNNIYNNINNKRTTQITTNLEECRPCPVFASFTLAFVLQLRKSTEKTQSGQPKRKILVNTLTKHPHITKPTHTYTLIQCPASDNVEKYGRAGRVTDGNIRNTLHALYMLDRVTDTRSKCIIHIIFPWQKLSRERSSMLPLYVHCLSSYDLY